MDLSLTFFLCAAPAIILFGIAKGAAIGSLALIAIPLMLLVMPLPQVLAVCLPLLIIMDWIAFYKYRKSFSKENLKFIETEKLFDPDEVYEGEDNPTIL